jgi:hypothetical protein
MDASRFDAFTLRKAERLTRRQALGTALAGVALGALDASAGAEANPLPATPTEGEPPAFLFVQTFSSGHGEANPGAGTPAVDGTPTPGGGASFLLTLEGHTGLTVYFSDRPDRIVGAMPTEPFLATLGFSADNPPNAALIGEFQAGQGVVVVQLIEPVYDPESETIVYGAEVLDAYQGTNLEPVTREALVERLPATFGPAALFIDDWLEVKDKRAWTSRGSIA